MIQLILLKKEKNPFVLSDIYIMSHTLILNTNLCLSASYWKVKCDAIFFIDYALEICKTVNATGVFSNFPLFFRFSGTSAITCSYKASSGLLYPLERGFIFVHKPPVHVRFDEISSVNFARGSTTGRTFDYEIDLKNGITLTFSNLAK